MTGAKPTQEMATQCWLRSACLALLISVVSACSSLGGAGPSTKTVLSRAAVQAVDNEAIRVVDLDATVMRNLLRADDEGRFSDAFGESKPVGTIIGRGDVLDISIWEAPPSLLFGTASASDARLGNSLSTARNISLPEQIVDNGGSISVPFVGRVRVVNRTPLEIEREIVGRLAGKANSPQAIVRVVQNASMTATIIGEVVTSKQVMLTSKGETLLDGLASSGGLRQPTGKITIQISRRGRTGSMPLDEIIRDPRQNVVLAPGDVVTALYQPYSFTALGAVGANAEINFEATGLTLAQALGRIGGLREDRADIRGVFVFRMENASTNLQNNGADSRIGSSVSYPVIYRVDLKNPSSFFFSQNFSMKNKDIIYVSTAPLADLQKFVGLISSMAITGISVGSVVP